MPSEEEEQWAKHMQLIWLVRNAVAGPSLQQWRKARHIAIGCYGSIGGGKHGDESMGEKPRTRKWGNKKDRRGQG